MQSPRCCTVSDRRACKWQDTLSHWEDRKVQFYLCRIFQSVRRKIQSIAHVCVPCMALCEKWSTAKHALITCKCSSFILKPCLSSIDVTIAYQREDKDVNFCKSSQKSTVFCFLSTWPTGDSLLTSQRTLESLRRYNMYTALSKAFLVLLELPSISNTIISSAWGGHYYLVKAADLKWKPQRTALQLYLEVRLSMPSKLCPTNMPKDTRLSYSRKMPGWSYLPGVGAWKRMAETVSGRQGRQQDLWEQIPFLRRILWEDLFDRLEGSAWWPRLPQDYMSPEATLFAGQHQWSMRPVLS